MEFVEHSSGKEGDMSQKKKKNFRNLHGSSVKSKWNNLEIKCYSAIKRYKLPRHEKN